jgi:hypothetical protein
MSAPADNTLRLNKISHEGHEAENHIATILRDRGSTVESFRDARKFSVTSLRFHFFSPSGQDTKHVLSKAQGFGNSFSFASLRDKSSEFDSLVVRKRTLPGLISILSASRQAPQAWKFLFLCVFAPLREKCRALVPAMPRCALRGEHRQFFLRAVRHLKQRRS